MAEKKKRPVGRPTKYRPEYAELAYKMCLLKNCTDEELAKIFGVETSTIYNWKHSQPKFLEAIQNGKEIADSKVVASLHERATGYSHPEDKIFLHEGQPVIVPTTKHYPPDTAAAFIWLKNRQSGKWRDRQEIEHSGKLEYEILLPEELGGEEGGSKGE